jgi:tetratricopeptide (TPR) repeat protein
MTHGAPEVRYVLAVQKWQSGDLRVAEDEARGAARADTGFLEARYLLGMIEAARGSLPHAAATLNDALHVDPGWAPVHLELGAVLAASGDLDGALAEMRLALSIDAALEPAGGERQVTFAARRVLPGDTHGSGMGLPLPVPRPAFLAAELRPPLLAVAESAAIPEWFLDYALAGFHEDNGAWGPAAKLFERALTLEDRETIRVPVGGRLVDYLPHRHLARVCFESGDLREARLHLEIARNQAATSANSLGLLGALMGIAATRTRLVLQPLPDHTADEAVAIRGLLLTRNRPAWVDIGGQKALLRPATAEDLRLFPGESSVTDAESGMQPLYFEVPSYPLPSVGPHRIRIRPGTAETAGAEAEVLIMRDAPPTAAVAHPAPGDQRSVGDGGGG